MIFRARKDAHHVRCLVVVAVILACTSSAAHTSTEHPLEPPDRSSPRATLTTFLDSVDRAWELYSAGDSGYVGPFRDARDCLDLSQVPPLVYHEVSAESALLLKEVLDRIELPPLHQIPDQATAEEHGLTRWVLPHTEIQLVKTVDGERRGQWVFSAGTVRQAEDFFTRVRNLPYRPGRTGGHLEELRAGTEAVVLMKLVEALPSWSKQEIGGTAAWQWFGLALLVALLALAVILIVWLGHRWRGSGLPGHRLAGLLAPLAMISIPVG